MLALDFAPIAVGDDEIRDCMSAHPQTSWLDIDLHHRYQDPGCADNQRLRPTRAMHGRHCQRKVDRWRRSR